jgi:hypothetical protein
MQAGHGRTKIRTAEALQRCLAALGSAPAEGLPDRLSDHESDALASAAGLRAIADRPGIWAPPGLDALARGVEGWIFGVTG